MLSLSSFKASRFLTLMFTLSAECQFPHQCWEWTFSSYMSWGAGRETHFPLLGKELTDDMPALLPSLPLTGVELTVSRLFVTLLLDVLTFPAFSVFWPCEGLPHHIGVEAVQKLRPKEVAASSRAVNYPASVLGIKLVLRKSRPYSMSRAISPALVLHLF